MNWNIYIIFPIIIFYIICIEMNSFIVNVWTQSRIRRLKNITLDKNNTCSRFNNYSRKQEELDMVQELTSHWLMYYTVAQLVPALFVSFVLPGCMDVYGRRCMFMCSLAGTGLKSVAVAIIIYTDQNFIFIVVAYFIEGCTGYYYTFYAASFTYFSDKTSTHNVRLVRFAFVEGTISLSSTVATFCSGMFIEKCGFLYPALTTVAISVSVLICALLWLPETLQEENRRESATLFKYLKRTFRFYVSGEIHRTRCQFILLIVAFLFIEIGTNKREGLETLYLLGRPFCWDSRKIGDFLAIRNVMEAFNGLVLVRILQKCFKNETIALFCLLVDLSTYLVEAFVRSDILIYTVAVVSSLPFISIPIIRGLMSSKSSSSEQGSLFASIAAVEALSSLISSVSSTAVYAATLPIMTGFVFIIMALFCFMSIVMLVLYIFKSQATVDYAEQQ